MAEITEVSGAGTRKKKWSKAEKDRILQDFRLACISREASIIARKEVLTGKAKFGIIGDGKEVAQLAMARAFKKGDWRSGYYRDQTLMFALDLSSLEDFFAQLYADAENDPFSGGRQMNSHFSSPLIDKQGNWLDHRDQYNISADISSTGGQMARALGLAFASSKYRNSGQLAKDNPFSRKGDEVVFCTIGDASTSEGVFWETINAAGVLRVPLSVSVWDDGFGISVPVDYQTTKGSISEVLEGFRLNEAGEGIDLYVGYGWDYPGLVDLYQKAIEKTRKTHIPSLIHVKEITQPQGHSTSGSHERYKSAERLEWEKTHDCITRMGQWMVEGGIATADQLDSIREEAKKVSREAKNRAWKAFYDPVKEAISQLNRIFDRIIASENGHEVLQERKRVFDKLLSPLFHEVLQQARRMQYDLRRVSGRSDEELAGWIDQALGRGKEWYNTHLYSDSDRSALKVPVVPPRVTDASPLRNGYEILNSFFDKVLDKHPGFFAFGEDLGKIGGVNQGFAGLQGKYGSDRVFDTGIREWTIMGQAIGMAMRGLRPLAEIQYLDYLIYGIEPLSDDLATVRWRSAGTQMAPAIIRTRGHRLEGIWHAGSPLGMIINSLRGMYICVPRNMTQAAGMYHTLLQSDDPGLVIECLNGYRLKEPLPENIGEYTVPLGVPEVLQEGTDLTLVTYGSCVRIAQEALELLKAYGVSVELIDVQTLLPFDLEQHIVASLEKTNRVVFLDEDVPGGASAYMMQHVLEVQGGYRYLDSEPRTLSAHPHRPAYGSDGDYFSKPNAEDVFELVMELMREAEPGRFS